MKIQHFKKLIKEAVREVLLEELQNLKEISTNSTPSKLSIDNNPPIDSRIDTSETNTISEMIEMTRRNMTREDFRSLTQSNVEPGNSTFNFTTQNLETSTSPQPGVDLSKLDFVKNAATIYNKAVEKDKFRSGG